MLEREILPARIDGYEPGDLDTLLAAGEVVWAGVEPLGDKRRPPRAVPHRRTAAAVASARRRRRSAAREQAIADHLQAEGASFFAAIHEAVGGGFPRDTVDALWDLVWRGLITNDALQALRAFVGPLGPKRRAARCRGSAPPAASFRSRRQVPPAPKAAGRC